MKFINKFRVEVHCANVPRHLTFCCWRRNFVEAAYFGKNWCHCVAPKFKTKMLHSERHEKEFSGAKVTFCLLAKSCKSLVGCSACGLEFDMIKISSIETNAHP